MLDVVVVQCTAFAVFQPFLGGLIAADVEIPRDLRNAFEVLAVVEMDTTKTPRLTKEGWRRFADGAVLCGRCLCNFRCITQRGTKRTTPSAQSGVHPSFVRRGAFWYERDLLYQIVPTDGKACDEFLNRRRFQQMYLPQLSAEGDEFPKRRRIFRIRNKRKVYLQEFFVFFSITRARQNGVDVIKNIYRSKSLVSTRGRNTTGRECVVSRCALTTCERNTLATAQVSAFLGNECQPDAGGDLIDDPGV